MYVYISMRPLSNSPVPIFKGSRFVPGGEVVFRPEDEYGQALEALDVEVEDFMALIRKPPREVLEQQLAPFTTKAYQDGGDSE